MRALLASVPTVTERLPEVRYSLTISDAGESTWRPRSFKFVEEIFELYEMSLTLVTDDLEADIEDLLGASLELAIDRGETPRYITGIVRQVEFQGVEHERFQVLVTVVPALWGLTKRNDSRHWQNMSVPDILEEVLSAPLAEHSREVQIDLQGDYSEREFCVQYHETDYDFARRLMAEEGIYFYFDCSAGQSEIVVLADVNDSLPEVPLADQGAAVSICNGNQEFEGCETVRSFGWKRKLQSTAVVQRDFDWLASPADPPTDEKREPDARGFEREVYEPGERRVGIVAGTLATAKLQSLVAKGSMGSGHGNVIGFSPGHHFALEEHHIPEVATEHLITRVSHRGTWETVEVGTSHTGTSYENSFETTPFDLIYKAPRTAQRPQIQGPQTGVVTGPSGEEIHVDEHGRVKVILVWDRLSAADDTSSCWMRVAQLSAGAGFGAMFIPRIGMEVVVEFLDGNPDRPLVTGCVYNGVNPPPYALPGDKTKSTIKTNSSPGGGGSNEVRFEDAAGSEELYFHAQKDLTIATENDKNQTTGNNETLSVGSNRTKTVGGNESEKIGANKKIKVGADHTETIGANRTLTVGANETCTIGASQTVSVGASASETVTIMKSTTVGAAYALSVGAAMTTTVGAALIESVGAARMVSVGAISSEKIGLAKTVSAKTISHDASTTYDVKVGTTFSVSATEDVGIQAGKKMTIEAKDDLGIGSEKKAIISAKDQLTIKVGKAKIVLKKNGDITIGGKKISVEASGDIVLKGSKILNN